MDPVKFPITITLLLLLIFALSPFTAVDIALVWIFLLLLSISTLWMVFKILKDGKPGKYTFDERWYDNH